MDTEINLKVLSVCICTYNGAKRIPDVLECLSLQTLPRDQWEVLVINNASTDRTASLTEELITRYQLPGRVVEEPLPGLSYARKCAAFSAQGEFVCFLDDDNLPDPYYLAEALRIFTENPKTGSIGAHIEADWMVAPTPLVQAVAGYALAIVDRGKEPQLYSWIADGPVGAGMCIRRDLLVAALRDSEVCRLVPARVGTSLYSGDDMALAVKVHQSGYEKRYDPSLRLRHRLDGQRMTREYLVRLYDGIGRGQVGVRQLWVKRGTYRLNVLVYGLKDWTLWLCGQLRGPANKPWLRHIPETTRSESPELSSDLHALEQSLLWGRVSAAWAYVFAPLKARG